MLMDMRLAKFDIYQGTAATNCFNSHTNSFFFLHACTTQRLTQVLHKKLQLW